VDTDNTLKAWGGAAFIPGRAEAVTVAGAFTVEDGDSKAATQEARAAVLTLMHADSAMVMRDIQIDWLWTMRRQNSQGRV
jgi:hypothetical protein